MDVERRLRTAVESFAVELDALVRLATIEAVDAAFHPGSFGGRFGLSGARSGAAASGAKRTAAELEAQAASLLATIRARPGLRIEQIAEAMAAPSRSLSLPMRKLLASRQVRKKGAKRATCYFAR